MLRATTTIAWALHHGAEGQAFADLEDLRAAAEAWPADQRLLLGERGGQTLAGFDLGNSPVAVLPATVSGKRLFMSTTNGTRAPDWCTVPLLVTAAPLNREAVAQRLLKESPETVAIVGSGWEGTYSSRILWLRCSGGVPAELNQVATLANDEATAAVALWQQWRHDPEAVCERPATGNG